MYRHTRRLVLAGLIFFATACAGTAGTQQGSADEPPAGTSLEPGIYDVSTGDRVEEQAFFDLVAQQRYVVVGEQHDRLWHHELQTTIFEAILERRDNPVAIGMEMFQHPYQPALTAYASGDIDESEMLERTEYESRWGFDTSYYSPLWRAAREHRSPIVALNAPRELSRQIAEVGVQGLAADQREALPEMDMENQVHREYVRRAFEAHGSGMDDAKFGRFYQAQVLWDETMAETAVEFMESHPHVETMMIVAGVAHADERFGIPPRIERRRADIEVLTIRPVTHEELSQGVTSLRAISEGESFDYIWVGGQ